MGENSRVEDLLTESVDRVLSGRVELVEVATHPSGALRFWIFKDPTRPEGVEMFAKPVQFAPLSPDARAFPACSSCPEGYPDAIPFLADSSVVISRPSDEIQVLWASCPHPLDGLWSIIEQSRDAGWVGASRDDVPLATRANRLVELRKTNAVRTVRLEISGNAGVLTLVDALA